MLGRPCQLVALTVEEILLLKQNGVSEETIQMMLQSEMRAQAQQDGTVDETMGIQNHHPLGWPIGHCLFHRKR
jgi:hypothetical protein